MAFLSETYKVVNDESPIIKSQLQRLPRDIEKEDEHSVPLVLVEEPSPHLKCTVCKRLYHDPVISVKCGHTFCRKCAFRVTHCPIDGQLCDTSQLVVNRIVVGQIEDLLIHCQYGLTETDGDHSPDPSGCQEHIVLGNREEHEANCVYAPVPCPNNSGRCGRFRKSELDQHLELCQFTPCGHCEKGCEFMSTAEEVRSHEDTTCGYRGLQKSVSFKDFNQQNRVLEENNKELREEVGLLTQRVELLEGGREYFQKQLTSCTSSLLALQQKYENIQGLVEQLLSGGRNRRSSGSPGNSQDVVRHRSSSSSTALVIRSRPGSPAKGEDWQMPFQFKCIGTLRGHKDIVWCLATQRQKLCSSGADGLVKVWDMETLAKGCIKTLEGHSKVVHTMVASGDILYTGGGDMSIRAWNMETLTQHSSVENAHDNIITAMVLVGDYLFSASHSLIKVWEAKTLTHKHTISGLHHWVRALCLNKAKDRLYSGSHNTIDIWDTTGTFDLKGKIDHAFGSVYSLAITHQYVIAGTYNQNIQVFDVETKQHTRSFQGHIGTINSLITSHSGRFLFSSSIDKAIQIWSLELMLPIQNLKRHEGSVNTLILLGDYLISGSEDHEIKVFKYFQMQMGFALQT
ncbi:E3 ubiquitin-protein ligase TRAF7-like isoform X1 [Mizuhopecten yessoensis]|uniref:E3 ubiquitin-protein ligase TRAF7 n=1 Tax=Mizuhopecten yessoensis TaxID=6573 RepID=A0A210PE45_MIZYE|nr:E3 ubiquitin-protein ligase TRAF7-like isoform X1 [Mizuhopecten yessoensis]OWF34765.1 E3 ubiquitin-protein ligase TRAF7 [Mizuhopecten yessoensis]